VLEDFGRRDDLPRPGEQIAQTDSRMMPEETAATAAVLAGSKTTSSTSLR
jgi:hypothetical protein